jgi:hypothetical protein
MQLGLLIGCIYIGSHIQALVGFVDYLAQAGPIGKPAVDIVCEDRTMCQVDEIGFDP